MQCQLAAGSGLLAWQGKCLPRQHLLRGAGERDAVAVGGDDVDAALLLQGLVDVQLAGEELQGQGNLAGLNT